MSNLKVVQLPATNKEPPDPYIIERAEALLAAAKAGEISSFLIVTVRHDTGVSNERYGWAGDIPDLMWAMDRLKFRMLRDESDPCFHD